MRGGGSPTQLGPLERTSLNHWTTWIGTTVAIRAPRLGSVKWKKLKVTAITVVKSLIYPHESEANNGVKIAEDKCDQEALPTHQRIHGNLKNESTFVKPSLAPADFFFYQGDPKRWNFKTGLANLIGRAGHVSCLLAFHVSAVSLNLQNLDLVCVTMNRIYK
jgi:hypothetical protein